jgi:hypothetical protein
MPAEPEISQGEKVQLQPLSPAIVPDLESPKKRDQTECFPRLLVTNSSMLCFNLAQESRAFGKDQNNFLLHCMKSLQKWQGH